MDQLEEGSNQRYKADASVAELEVEFMAHHSGRLRLTRGKSRVAESRVGIDDVLTL